MFDDLYNTDILGLAASLKNERLEDFDGNARKVSKLCGSWLEIDIKIEDARIVDCALRVQACALGQASAAILKEKIIGASYDEIVHAREALKTMLKANGAPPAGRFEKLALLRGVSEYPARHMSTLLAFDAACEAFAAALPSA